MSTRQISTIDLHPETSGSTLGVQLALRTGEDQSPTRIEREEAVRRVLQSPSFAKANRLSAFLEYVCRLTLEGRETEISELNIGTNVFERNENYNASDDTIVRTTARLLRQRLESYYAGDGQSDSIRIDIPRGGYVPYFLKVAEQTISPAGTESLKTHGGHAAVAEPSPTTSPGRGHGSFRVIAGIAFGLCLGFLAAFLAFAPHSSRPWSMSPSEELWSALFTKDRDTLVVPADTMLLWYEVGTHHLVPLGDYIDRHLFQPTNSVNPELGLIFNNYDSMRYTAVTSVAMAAELGRIPKAAPDRLQVRFARDLQLSDLKQSNAILLGAGQNNPWVRLFQRNLNFHLDWDAATDGWHIRNDHPANGEPTEFSWTKDDPDHKGYSQIAVLHNLTGTGYVLVLAGTNMAGTQAASEFIFTPQKLDPVLRQAIKPGGVITPFEVLLQSNLLGNGTVNTRVMGVRFHP